MINLIKADFKKVYFLSSKRNFLIATFLLSILLGLTFLFTIGITQGKELTELSGLEVIDITLLGIDVTAIMLIIFTAVFISTEFSHGSIHTSLAITPLRKKLYLSKILFITILSFIVSIVLTLIIFGIVQLVLLLNNMDTVSLFSQPLIFKLAGAVILPVFYSLLSAAGTFYLRSAAGGTAFAIGVMFIPALFNMFPPIVSETVLAILPQDSLHAITEISSGSMNGQLISAILILSSWIGIANSLGLWKFKKVDF